MLGRISFWLGSSFYNTIRFVVFGDRPPSFCNERIIEIPWASRKICQFPKSARILEFGNVLGPTLARSGYNVETVDTSDYDEVVRGWTHIRLNICDLDIRDSYDVALSISTIEHVGLGHYGDAIIPDGDRKAVERLAQALRAGGLLYATVPFAPVMTTTWQRFYDLESLQRLFGPHFSFRIEVHAFSGLKWHLVDPDSPEDTNATRMTTEVVTQVALIEATKAPMRSENSRPLKIVG